MSLLKPEDVASHLQISRAEVVARCLAKEWPHTRVGKFYRFTPADLEGIEQLCAVKPAAPTPEQTTAQTWGVVTRGNSA